MPIAAAAVYASGMEPILIDGEFRAAERPAGEFAPWNPNTRKPHGERYPISGSADVDACLGAATACRDELGRSSPDAVANFLDAFATGI